MDFSCTKCGSVDVYIDERGNQKALMCKDCSSWIKWIGKKEMPLVAQYIRDHKEPIATVTTSFTYTQPITYTLKTDRIKNLDDVKRVLEFLNIQITLDNGVSKYGYEKVKDLFE